MANIKNFDIMQHIDNIYKIIGITDPESIQNASNLNEIIAQLCSNGQPVWIGSEADYEFGRSNGTITDNTVCIVTDD